MPCDTLARTVQKKLEREQQLKDLEKALKLKSAKIARIGNQVVIEGWADRGGWCDECAIRALRQSADFEVRRMVAAAAPVGQALRFGHAH